MPGLPSIGGNGTTRMKLEIVQETRELPTCDVELLQTSLKASPVSKTSPSISQSADEDISSLINDLLNSNKDCFY